jgi:carboxymethylenebutenolidase
LHAQTAAAGDGQPYLPSNSWDVAMRLSSLVLVALAASIGYAVARARPAAAVDEHANHEDHGAATAPSTIASAQQATNLPASGTAAAERIAKSPRHGEWVAVKAGADSVMSWVVYPERSTKAPVVIVLHENTGLTTWARAVADQMAAEGFIAIAPDMLTPARKGNLTSEWARDSAGPAIRELTTEMVNARLDAVAKYGMSLPAALPKYGIVGFCWGGGRSFLHAVHSPSLGASVVYYGSPPSAEQLASIKAPVLGLYGGSDARITATVPATDSAMKRLAKSYEFHVYEGAGHGFLRGQEQNDGANLKAAQAAWPTTVTFLKAKLGA